MVPAGAGIDDIFAYCGKASLSTEQSEAEAETEAYRDKEMES